MQRRYARAAPVRKWGLRILCFFILSSMSFAAMAIDGLLDPRFDGDGRVITLVTTGGVAVNSSYSDVAVQSDGRIVAVGDVGPALGSTDWMMVRYLSNGALDTDFGSGGIVPFRFDLGAGDVDRARRVLILPDGKILVLGDVAGGQLASGTPGNHSIALARFNPNGTLDLSFGSGGTLLISQLAPVALYAADLLLGPDGHYVVIANAKLPATVAHGPSIYVFSYTPSTLAFRFQAIDFDLDSLKDDSASAARFTADGKLVVVGSASFNVGSGTTDYDYAIARLNYSDFSFDAGFHPNGRASFDMHCGGSKSTDTAIDLSPRSDGSLIVAGNCSIDDSGHVKVAVIRLLSNGSPDTSFGGAPNGKVILSFGNSNIVYSSYVARMLTQGDGKMLLVGSSANGGPTGQQDAAILRLLDNGLTDDAGFQTNTLSSLPGRGFIRFDDGASAASGASAAFDGGRVVLVGFSLASAFSAQGGAARLSFDQIFIDRFEGPAVP
jgi:uncharacterized delta-60 repeat protein